MLYLAVLFPFIAHYLPIKSKKVKVLISVMPAIFIILFRFGLGTDYFSYEFFYNQHNVRTLMVALNSHKDSMEIGFRFLIYIFKSLGLPFQVFVASISLLIYYFFIKWLTDIELDSPLLIMMFNGMFFIVWVLSGLRQGLVLAVGTYFFFNEKVKLKTWQEILLILFLGLFHFSAYIYLLVIVAKKFDFNRKKLSIILLLSLIFTLIPYYKLLIPFDDIIIIEKFLVYLTASIGFWDFPGLIRLGFAAFVLLFYNVFSNDKFIKHLADMSILGFSVYFILKASEVVASRLNIFTFVLIIPLFIYFVKTKFTNQTMYILATIGLLSFSIIYLEKDLIGHQKEVKALNVEKIYKLKPIYNRDETSYLNYNNRYAFITNQNNFCNINKQLSLPDRRNKKAKELIVLQDAQTKLYGLLNNLGEWHIEPIFETKPELLDDIIVLKENDTEVYLNLENKEIKNVEDKVLELRDKAQLIKDEEPQRTYVDYSRYKSSLDKLFPIEDEVEEVLILTYKLPFDHSILRIFHNNRFHFFLLDNDLDIKYDLVFKRAIRYGLNNMAFGNTYCGYIVINSDGDIINLLD